MLIIIIIVVHMKEVWVFRYIMHYTGVSPVAERGDNSGGNHCNIIV